MPDAYSEAPAPVAVLIAGVMAKTGAYGFIRFNLTLFPAASRSLMPLMSILAVVGILYFALQALVAQDFKAPARLCQHQPYERDRSRYLRAQHPRDRGRHPADGQSRHHHRRALPDRRRSSRRGPAPVVWRISAVWPTRLPWLATAFLIAALAALGLPGLNSFAGEFLAFLGAFQSSYVFGVLGTLVVIPAAWYMLRFFQGVMEGPATAKVGIAAVAANGSVETTRP